MPEAISMLSSITHDLHSIEKRVADAHQCRTRNQLNATTIAGVFDPPQSFRQGPCGSARGGGQVVVEMLSGIISNVQKVGSLTRSAQG